MSEAMSLSDKELKELFRLSKEVAMEGVETGWPKAPDLITRKVMNAHLERVGRIEELFKEISYEQLAEWDEYTGTTLRAELQERQRELLKE